jgi:dipeptidyl aminopeptidase/acylaminoacyl peptidase
MKIKIVLYSLILLATLPVTAQNGAPEKELTFQDLIPGGSAYSRFIPQNIQQLQWCGDLYTCLKGDSLLLAYPDAKKEPLAFTCKQLNEALTSAGLPETGAMPFFFVPDKKKTELAFQYQNNRVHYNPVTRQITAHYALDKSGSRWEYDKANGNLAFTKENNVYVLTPGGETETVTAETEAGIVCGTAVHQNEFGIHKGLFWSPEGSALAFYRMDESMVTDYPVVHISERVATVEPFKYPMAGMKSHEVTVGVYRLPAKRTVWLKTGLPKEKYLTNITWSPDGKSIYIAELNRGQDTCRLVRYSAETGEREAELFTETNPYYVEPQEPLLFLPGNPGQFIWQSQRDGYNHLYLYDTEGRLLRQLTTGLRAVREVTGFDRKGEHLFFMTAASRYTEEDSPPGTYAWKLNLKTGKQSCLSIKKGVHQVSLNASATYLIDQTSSPVIPRDIDLIETKDGRQVKSLLSAGDPFENYRMPDIKVGTLTAADNRTTLYYRLVTPPDLDKTKKYPVIVYVYGGPHAQMVTGNWMYGAGGWDVYMARRGYILFTIYNRGSANRGFEFERVIHRQLGEAEMADQLKGIDFLKSLPYVDAGRIGVHGWSYGGFMTINLMLTHPDLFKAGVAGGPVTDWHHYEIMYGERYMDHPEDNPEGYKNANLLNKAGNLKGNLLVIHGDEDPVVVWQHSLLFMKACVYA